MKRLLRHAAVVLTVTLFCLPLLAQGTKAPGQGCILPRDCASGMCRLWTTVLICAAPDHSVPTSGECHFDSECAVSKCRNQVCGCETDADCTATEYCTVAKICKTQHRGWDGCFRDRECTSGSCVLCGPQAFNPSICSLPTRVGFGAACKLDKDCIKGKCSSILCDYGTCVCAEDSDCPAGQRCKKGPLGIGKNECVPK